MVGLEGPGQLLMYIIALPRGFLVSYRRTGPGMQDKMVCFLCCRSMYDANQVCVARTSRVCVSASGPSSAPLIVYRYPSRLRLPMNHPDISIMANPPPSPCSPPTPHITSTPAHTSTW